MKRSILHAVTILLAACAAVVATGCGGDDTPSTPQTATLRATPQSLDFTADSYSQTISVESSGGRWLVSSADGWCQTDVTSGSGNGTVNVSVSANPEQSERSTRLTLRMTGADDVVVTVRQSAPGEEGIVVEPDPWDGVKRADITYQLLIYSFADSDGDGMGDFRGIISKLDYLDRLGVSAIWLSPAPPAASYHGYDVKDYEALNPAYGTEEDFKALIDAAHEHGIKVYMDYVINHTSKEHPWFVEALSGEDNPYRGYYVLSNDPAADIAAGRIPMIATEGASGYDAGQWFAAVTSASASLRSCVSRCAGRPRRPLRSTRSTISRTAARLRASISITATPVSAPSSSSRRTVRWLCRSNFHRLGAVWCAPRLRRGLPAPSTAPRAVPTSWHGASR